MFKTLYYFTSSEGTLREIKWMNKKGKDALEWQWIPNNGKTISLKWKGGSEWNRQFDKGTLEFNDTGGIFTYLGLSFSLNREFV